MKCHMRVARPVTDVVVTKTMYCDGLNFQLLGEFCNHDGFDGIMLGSPSMNYHFEFTKCEGHKVTPSSTPEDLIVFYEADEITWTERCDLLTQAGFRQVKSFNPYWDVHGRTFQDADGYRMVIQNAEWSSDTV